MSLYDRAQARSNSSVVKIFSTVVVPTSTNTQIFYNDGVLNEGWRNGSNDAIVVPYDGVYQVTSTISYATMVVGTRLRNFIRVNATTMLDIDSSAAATAGYTVSTSVECTAGDEISVLAWQNSGTSRSLNSNTTLTVSFLG